MQIDPLLISVIVVAAILVVLFVKWLISDPDPTEAQNAQQLPDDTGVLTELERIRQKPPGPFL